MEAHPRQEALQEWYEFWKSQQTGDETPEEADAALLALILEGRRIVIGMPLDHPRLVEMERETVELLGQPDFLKAADSQREVVFRRLAEGRGTGWAYLTEIIEGRSAKFSRLADYARKPDIFSRIIDQLVAENPTISEKEVLRRLKGHRDFDVLGNEIRYLGDDEASEAASLPVGRLGSRLIDRQSQNMTVAARATADRKVLAHLS